MICAICNGSGQDPAAVALEKLGAVIPLICSSCNGRGSNDKVETPEPVTVLGFQKKSYQQIARLIKHHNVFIWDRKIKAYTTVDKEVLANLQKFAIDDAPYDISTILFNVTVHEEKTVTATQIRVGDIFDGDKVVRLWHEVVCKEGKIFIPSVMLEREDVTGHPIDDVILNVYNDSGNYKNYSIRRLK